MWGMGVFTCVLPFSDSLPVKAHSPQSLNGIPEFALQVSNQLPNPILHHVLGRSDQNCDSRQRVTASNTVLRRAGRGRSRAVWEGLGRCLSGSEICCGC